MTRKNSQSTTEQSDSGIQRRTFLQTSAVGIGTIAGVSIASADENTVDVPLFVNDGEVLKYASVDAEWWDHVQHVKNIRRKEAEDLRDHNSVMSVGITSGDDRIGGNQTREFTVTYVENGSEGGKPTMCRKRSRA